MFPNPSRTGLHPQRKARTRPDLVYNLEDGQTSTDEEALLLGEEVSIPCHPADRAHGEAAVKDGRREEAQRHIGVFQQAFTRSHAPNVKHPAAVGTEPLHLVNKAAGVDSHFEDSVVLEQVDKHSGNGTVHAHVDNGRARGRRENEELQVIVFCFEAVDGHPQLEVPPVVNVAVMPQVPARVVHTGHHILVAVAYNHRAQAVERDIGEALREVVGRLLAFRGPVADGHGLRHRNEVRMDVDWGTGGGGGEKRTHAAGEAARGRWRHLIQEMEKRSQCSARAQQGHDDAWTEGPVSVKTHALACLEGGPERLSDETLA